MPAKIADKYLITEPWTIVEEGFDPARARVSESIFSLANEFMGCRGYFEEGYSFHLAKGDSRLHVEVTPQAATFRVTEGEPLEIDVYGKPVTATSDGASVPLQEVGDTLSRTV